MGVKAEKEEKSKEKEKLGFDDPFFATDEVMKSKEEAES